LDLSGEQHTTAPRLGSTLVEGTLMNCSRSWLFATPWLLPLSLYLQWFTITKQKANKWIAQYGYTLLPTKSATNHTYTRHSKSRVWNREKILDVLMQYKTRIMLSHLI